MKQCIAVLLWFILLSSAVSQERNAVYHNKEGWSHLEKRQALDAVTSFKSALSQNPDYKEARIGLGRAYIMRSAYSEAFDIFQALAALYPEDEAVVVGLADSLNGLTQYDEALEQYRKASELNAESTEALYGTASVYYQMNKPLWAERTIEQILRLNPYHYDTLLLAARIKNDARRLDEAEAYITKAINVRREFADAYVSFGRLLLHRYVQENDGALLADARREFERAALIDPGMPSAQEMLGTVSLLEGDPLAARKRFERARKADPDSLPVLYNLAYCLRLLGERGPSEEIMLDALSHYPDDPLVNASLERFYVEYDYAFGNPGRLDRAKEHYALYEKASTQNLSEYALLHLRRSVLLNPMNETARRNLADYYKVVGYHRLYVDELKNIQRLYPGTKNREELNIAVINRREMLYNREGYAHDMPPRHVVRIAVVPFDHTRMQYGFYDGGEVFADGLSFALRQFGRLDAAGLDELVKAADPGVKEPARGEILESLAESDIDYIVTGEYSYTGGMIEAGYSLRNNKTGGEELSFSLQEDGKDAFNRINYRAAKRLFGHVPVRGAILKLDPDSALVNVGSYDGIAPGDMLYARDMLQGAHSPRKILFQVTESDTFLSRVELVNDLDYDHVSKGNMVYGLKRRRARLLE
ncbi:MAG: tetratricopeptide repeat protein [Spirochaetota bacterium]